MTHYRTTSEARHVTLAFDSDSDQDVLVHVECANRNPETLSPTGEDYTYEDGDCCPVCGNDLAHKAAAEDLEEEEWYPPCAACFQPSDELNENNVCPDCAKDITSGERNA